MTALLGHLLTAALGLLAADPRGLDKGFYVAPYRASSLAGAVDYLFYFLLAVSVVITFGVATTILVFVVKYRRRYPDQTGADLPTYMSLEITWTLIPLGIAMVMFTWGAWLYVRMSRPPADAMEVHVIGKQWMWKVQHPEGRREINELHVPVGRPIKLVMTSQDVIHSFYIPAFRIKQDVLPGRYSQQWFTATRVGEYHLFCAEYCGTQHSKMIGRVVVMPPNQYQTWLSGGPDAQTAADRGAQVFRDYGCMACHGQQGPTLAGLYGAKVLLQDGRTIAADDDYLRESILDPQAKLVAGFPPIMPSFRGQLSEDQVFDLIAYIKVLKQAARPPAQDQIPAAGLSPQTAPATTSAPSSEVRSAP